MKTGNLPLLLIVVATFSPPAISLVVARLPLHHLLNSIYVIKRETVRVEPYLPIFVTFLTISKSTLFFCTTYFFDLLCNRKRYFTQRQRYS
jgi:hypothetical protein